MTMFVSCRPNPETQYFYMTFSYSIVVAELGSYGCILKKLSEKVKNGRQGKALHDLHQGAEFREKR